MATDNTSKVTIVPEAIIFHHQGKKHTVFFNQPNAVLPLKLKAGGTSLLKWGRRENENSALPMGGWARLNSIKNDKNNRWHLYSPRPVQVIVEFFMERDFESRPVWYEVTKGKCIQGLLAHIDNEYRAYIVTVEPEDLMLNHYRWPNIVTSAIKWAP